MVEATQPTTVESFREKSTPFLKGLGIIVLAWVLLITLPESLSIDSYGVELVYTLTALGVVAALTGAYRPVLENRRLISVIFGVVVALAIVRASIMVGMNVYHGVYWNLETIPTTIDRPIDQFFWDITATELFTLFVVIPVSVGLAWRWVPPRNGRPWAVAAVSFTVVVLAELGRTAANGVHWYVVHTGEGNDVTLAGRIVYHMARDLRGSIVYLAILTVVLVGIAVGVSWVLERVR